MAIHTFRGKYPRGLWRAELFLDRITRRVFEVAVMILATAAAIKLITDGPAASGNAAGGYFRLPAIPQNR